MIDTATIERYMRDANPIPHIDDLDPDEFARFVAAADAKRAAIMQAPTQSEPTESHPTTPQPSRSRRAWAFAAAFVLILASIGIAALFLRGDGAPVIDEPQAPPEIEQLKWTRVADDAAVFAPAGYSWINSVTSGGPGLVAVGGSDGGPAVWTSLDGDEWSLTLHADPLEDEAQGWIVEPIEMRSVTAAESGLYAVGYGGYGDLDPDGGWGIAGMVWTSPDGTDWTAAPDIAVFRDSKLFDIVEGGRGLVAVGHSHRENAYWDSGRALQAAVWSSSDGATWTQADVPTSYGEHSIIVGVTVGGPGLVAVGVSGDDAAVWTSRDGNVWNRVPHDETVFGGSGYQMMSGVTVGGSGLVAVGGDRGLAAVWTSSDGSRWSRVPHDIDVFGEEIQPQWDGSPGDCHCMDDIPMRAVIAIDSGLVAVGHRIVGVESGSGDQLTEATVWISRNGATWFRTQELESDTRTDGMTDRLVVEENTAIHSVVEDSNGLIAVGTRKGHSSAAVWVARP